MPVEFEGELEYIGPTSWRVSNRQVDITPQTVIIGGPPAIGQDLEIRATVATDGTPVAEIVRIVPPGSEVALGAMVAAIEPDTGSGQVWDMIVFPSEPWSNPFAMQVHVNGNTLVDERRAVARPGQWADVIALPLDREKYQADRIRLEQPIPVTISGGLEWVPEGGNKASDGRTPVTSVGEDGLSRGVVLPISKTDIDGSWHRINGRPVWIPRSISDLLDRQYMDDVSVEGLLLGNGVIWARKVHTLTSGIR
jgi:hypothetical protein